MTTSISRRRRIQNLTSHAASYVTVSELAEYWLVSRKMIYKQIEAGTLHTIKLGPRLLRIRTTEAADFERRAGMYRPTLSDQPAAVDTQRLHPAPGGQG